MSWEPIGGRELALIRQRIKSDIKPSGLLGYAHRPGFYRRGALVRLEATDRTRLYVAAGAEALPACRFHPLDGSAESIRIGNEAAGIEISSAEDAAAYLRFFCAALRTDDGASFNIVEALPPGCATDRRFHIDIAPLASWPSGLAGQFGARAFIEHGGELFIADFAIRADGFVAMVEDEPLGRLVRLPAN